MKKYIAILILLSFAAPVRAGLVTEFDPVEKKLLDTRQTEEKLNQDFAKPQAEPAKKAEEPSSGGSNWWKWALGIVVIGGIAAAAGGGGGGGSSSGSSGSGSSSSGGTGSTTVTW